MQNEYQSLQIQEQEFHIIAKECCYVLSHVCQSVGQTEEARMTLDRIEKCIVEQKERSEKLFTETMTRLSTEAGGEKSRNNASNSSNIALEGTKQFFHSSLS